MEFIFIISNVMAMLQVIFNYINFKLLMLNKKISFSEILSLVIVTILNGKVFSILGVYGIIFMFFCITILGYHFISKNLIQVLGVNSYVVIISVISDHCVSIIRKNIFGTEMSSSGNLNMFIQVVLSLLLSVVITFMIAKEAKRLGEKFPVINESAPLIHVIGIVTMIIYYVSIFFGVYLGNNNEIVTVNLIFFLLYLAASLVSFFMYISSLKNKYDTQQKEREYLENQRYMEVMENQYKEIRKFRHDYKNILNSLEDFIVDRDYEGLSDYYFNKIKKTSTLIDQNDFKLEAIGNIRVREVKSILASKLISMQEKGIDTQLEVNGIIEELSIDSISLVRILGIFLDNSIEELEFLGEGKLAVAVYKDVSAVHIIIQNSCRSDLPKFHILKQRGFSLKGAGRGEGLSNVQELIRTLKNVRLATSISDGMFTQKLTIEHSERV
ncbi:GHKL domain-containing protein [Enterococcus sp. AZ020]|uniref:GHKL domain-containing protein n=2 Tax=unclassified Enterococcus TaxID=2608891 RepID=UPI003D2C2E74